MSNMNFLYELITKRILNLIENGTPPWKKPWKASDLPMNLVTKIPYRGVNIWLLLSLEMPSPYFLTWKQTMALKGTVKKEEAKNYQIVVFWKQLKYKKNVDGIEEENTFPMLRYYRVYNLSQVELPAEAMKKLVPKKEVKQVNKLEECENIVKNYATCPEIKFGGDRAYYSTLMDKIQMPLQSDFNLDEHYYASLFHEMAHSTGSEKRLKRFRATDSNIFGSEVYSKEELIAEMSASFLAAEAGIENTTIENSANYIKGWLSAIKNGDKNFVISAAAKAQAAVDYILGRLTKNN